MQKPFYVLCVILILLLSCKNKKKNNTEDDSSFFPALSFIKSQVAHVDSSVYRIIKVTKVDSVSDTTFLKREEFKEAAKDFFALPDISSDDSKDDYKETKLYDQDLEQVVLNYMPVDPDKQITRQEVMIKPGQNGSDDKVQSIFINESVSKKDSTITKVLFWEVDKKFRVVTTTQKPEAKERTEIVEVIWNDFQSQ